MAFTLTELSSVSKYGSNTDLPSFTSTNGELLLLSIIRRRNDLPSSIGTNHGTFTLINSVSGNNRVAAIYAAISIGATGSLTVSFPSSNTGAASIIEVSGADTSATAADAIVQSATLNQYNGGGGSHTNTVSLSAFASTTNATFLIGQESGTTTGETGYTQESDIGDLNAWYKLSEDTTPSFTTTNNFTNVKAVACEIKEATSTGITVTGQTANYDYSGVNGTVDLAGEISVIGQTASYTYQAINGTVDLTGAISVIGQTANYSYTAIQGSVLLTGEIQVTGQTANYDYNAIQGSIQLSGEILVTGQTANYNYVGVPASVSIFDLWEIQQPVNTTWSTQSGVESSWTIQPATNTSWSKK